MNDSGNITKRGYVISQFSKFIPPGFVRVKTETNPQDYLYVTAYKNASAIVIVAVNHNFKEMNFTFNLENVSEASFSRYTTSPSKNCLRGEDPKVVNVSFSSVLDSLSVATFVSN